MGFTGQGMVIGNQDTGMRWTHAALRPHYRGWNGSAADHNYSWHDAVHSGGGSCGPNTTAPCDDSGHGTHTTGTTVGDDGLGNQVGVAPGARWIGCRNMDQGNGTPATYTECFQFMIAPTDLSGNNANPALRPHVINNSWSCPASEGCTTRTELETIINNTQAAGIFVATSAGNGGPNCSTVNDPPGIYAASFAAGAYDINNTLANFSSRGPSTYYTPNLLKPNISAPGVNVRSTTNGGDTSYGVLNGTSMASPHVAGVVALLWSAHPELVRDIDATKALLQNTANPSITVAAQTCGGTPSSQIPNNSFGYGRVDAFAAVNSPPPAADATVQVGPGGSMTFDPPVANILVGQTVKWVWASPSHSVRSGTPAAPTNTFLSGIQDPPFAFYHKFPDVGGYDYFCEVHSSMMTGSISVSAPPAPTPTATAAQTPTPTPSSTPTPSPSSSAAASPSPSATPSPSPASVLGNISSRTRVETGDNVLIGGFIITGVPDKKVIVRALGPSLTLPDRLADPILELRDSSGRVVQSNDNWSTSPNRQAIMDAGLAPSNDFESAIIATLPANGNSYTAIVHGVGGITGTAVVEVYDIDRTVDSKLANLSTRGLVQTGDTILIAGTIVVGQQPQKVLVRAIGPSLDLPGKLADPILELRDANGTVVRADDNWRTGGQAAEIMQTTLAPTNDFESALIETLPANSAHTAIVRGVNSSTGIAVVEVYALN
jgi:subtilisin family serine protease